MTGDERKLRVALAQAQLMPCLMCGGQPDMAGLYFPDDAQAWGAKPGKGRVVAYALCEDCKAEHTPEAFEHRLARKLRRRERVKPLERHEGRRRRRRRR